MTKLLTFYKKRGSAAVVLSVIITVLLVVTVVEAATTISTNISTGGTLSVTGLSTLSGGIESDGDLDIGTTTADTISIGRSGQTTNVLGNLSVTEDASFPGGATIGTAGTEIEDHFSNNEALNFPAIGANDCEELTMAVTGVRTGSIDTVALGIQDNLASASSTLAFTGWVSANDTVTVRVCQVAGQGTSDLPNATIRASVWQYEVGDE